MRHTFARPLFKLIHAEVGNRRLSGSHPEHRRFAEGDRELAACDGRIVAATC
jgi:hypothetical protein